MGSPSPWDHPSYYWVVICKNKWFHGHENIWVGHKIVLGETDAVAPLPEIGKSIQVQCDECVQEYTYKPNEVLRLELEHAESFTSHPLFLEQPTRLENVAPASTPPTALHSVAHLRELAKSLLANAARSLRRQHGRGQKNP